MSMKTKGGYVKKKSGGCGGEVRGRALAAVLFSGRNFLRVAAALREAASGSAVAAAPAAAGCGGNNFAFCQRGQGLRKLAAAAAAEEEEGG